MRLTDSHAVPIPIVEHDTEHFLVNFENIGEYFSKNKHHKMEFFYRKMRQRFDVLMDAGKPLGGQWNYDREKSTKLLDMMFRVIRFLLQLRDNVNYRCVFFFIPLMIYIQLVP